MALGVGDAERLTFVTFPPLADLDGLRLLTSLSFLRFLSWGSSFFLLSKMTLGLFSAALRPGTALRLLAAATL